MAPKRSSLETIAPVLYEALALLYEEFKSCEFNPATRKARRILEESEALFDPPSPPNSTETPIPAGSARPNAVPSPSPNLGDPGDCNQPVSGCASARAADGGSPPER